MDHVYKGFKQTNGLIFGYHEMSPSGPCIIIYYSEEETMTSMRLNIIWSPSIHMDKFKSMRRKSSTYWKGQPVLSSFGANITGYSMIIVCKNRIRQKTHSLIGQMAYSSMPNFCTNLLGHLITVRYERLKNMRMG